MSTIKNYLSRRSSGLRNFGHMDSVYNCLYSSIGTYKTWDEYGECHGGAVHGGVFNLEFSPDGSILVAACEKKSIVLFDTISYKQTATIKQAHFDCVNCVKFLDDRIFATCSDDCSVAIWDVRNVKTRVRLMTGHQNWVKNIEYSKRDNLIVTSGFDGSVYTWDINSAETTYKRIFHTPGLMRCRISPDDSKLVISTTGGYLIIIHDLNLSTMSEDLAGFRPNIHRLMQLGNQFFPIVSEFKHVFDRRKKRNRVELVSDFPEGDEAEVICSLLIHPQGWCALSRNLNCDEQSEWTCVHDIQELAPKPEETDSKSSEEDEDDLIERDYHNLKEMILNKIKDSNPRSRQSVQMNKYLKKLENIMNLMGYRNMLMEANNAHFSGDLWAVEVRFGNRHGSHRTLSRISSGLISNNLNVPSSSNLSTGTLRRRRRGSSEESEEDEDIADADDSDSENDEVEESDAEPDENFQKEYSEYLDKLIEHMKNRQAVSSLKYRQNAQRLLYYIQESNKGQGFIKELCFSADGRVICSPYDRGIRLLSFDGHCRELPSCVESWTESPKPKPLVTINTNADCHEDIVVCTKFSPKYPLLVSGCLKGKIVWHQPRL